jgi:hypothetical protein
VFDVLGSGTYSDWVVIPIFTDYPAGQIGVQADNLRPYLTITYTPGPTNKLLLEDGSGQGFLLEDESGAIALET